MSQTPTWRYISPLPLPSEAAKHCSTHAVERTLVAESLANEPLDPARIGPQDQRGRRTQRTIERFDELTNQNSLRWDAFALFRCNKRKSDTKMARESDSSSDTARERLVTSCQACCPRTISLCVAAQYGASTMSMLKPMRAACRAGTLALSLVLAPIAGGQQPCNTAVNSSTPDSDFTVNNDGTVTHHKTGLMWSRNPLNGTYSWEQALMEAEGASFAGYTDWRLPNAKELASIVETRCYAPSINLAVFPSTPSVEFWTSTPFVAEALGPSAWVVWFYHGSVVNLERNFGAYVRLVRGGE